MATMNTALWTTERQTEMYRFFSVAFNAAPGTTYMDQLYDAVISGMSTKEIVNAFVTKTEFTSVYPRSMANASFATKIVDNVVGSSASATAKAAAVADITAALTAGMSRGDIVYQIFTNLANKPATDADWAGTAKQMANQVEVAKYYTETLNSSGTDLATLRKVVAGVTDQTDTSSPTALAAVITTALPPAAKNISLTAGTDTGASFSGGDGNDTFAGLVSDAAATTTLTPGDSLMGGAGQDSLSLSISGGTGTGGAATTVTTTAFVMSGVETINVSNYNIGNGSPIAPATAVIPNNNVVNLAQAPGISTIALVGSAATANTSFTNVGAIAKAEMGGGSGGLNIGYVSTVVAGTADAQTLTLKGQTSTASTASTPSQTGIFTVNGIETLTVNSTGATNTVNIADAGSVTKLVVVGDQNITIRPATFTVDLKNVAEIDASSLTKALNYSQPDTIIQKITGGSGNDSLTINQLTAADTIDGGAGNDTISTTGTLLTDANFGKVTNVETVTLTGASSLTLAAPISATAFNLNADTSAAAQTIALSAGYTGATSVSISSGDSVTNAANVALIVSGTRTAIAGSTVTGGTGSDTINITANEFSGLQLDGSTVSLSPVALAGRVTKVDVLNIIDGGDTSTSSGATTGLAGRDISIDVGAYATALVVDATALDAGTTNTVSGVNEDEQLTLTGTLATAALTVTGGGGADTITGGTANDVLSGGGGNDSLNGSAGGSDNISGGDGNDTINMGSALTSADTIDGGGGNDTLLASSFTATSLTNVSNVEALGLTGDGLAVTLAANLGISTVRFDQDGATPLAQTLVLATGYTSAVSVYIDGSATKADKVTNSANVALTVYAPDTAFGTTVSTVTGGTGTDILSLLPTNTSAPAASLASVTGIDQILIRDAGDAVSGVAGATTTTAGRDVKLTSVGSVNSTATAPQPLLIDASSLDAAILDAAGETLATAETLTVTGNYAAGALTVLGGGGNDSIDGGTGGSALAGDMLSGGDGSDRFFMTGSASLNYLDTISGGNGTDAIYVAAAIDDSAFVNVSSVEQLWVRGASAVSLTIGGYASTAGIVTVSNNASAAGGAQALSLNASAMTKGLSILADVAGTATVTNEGGWAGSSKNHSVTGGLGNDTITMRFNDLTTGDVIKGGSGTDTLSLLAGASTTGTAVTYTSSGSTVYAGYTASGGSLTTAAATLGDVQNISKVVISNNLFNVSADATLTLTIDASYGSTASNGQTGIVLAVDASSLLGTGTEAATPVTYTEATGGLTGTANKKQSFVLDASANASTERVSVVGGGGDDTLQGGSGADFISGGAGADSLVGNAGSDTLSGGSGSDLIWGGTGVDSMSGGTGSDTFYYAGSAFETGTVPSSVVYYGGTVAIGSVVSTAGFDKIVDFTTGDIIQTNSPAWTFGTNGVDKLWTATGGLLRGAFDATAQTFTFSATGLDTLYVWDVDGQASTANDLVAVVLVGYVDQSTSNAATTGLVGNGG